MAWDKTKPANGTPGLASEVRGNFLELDRLMRSGDNITNGSTGRTITLSPVLQDTSYMVDIELTGAQSGFAGAVRITNKATNGFVVNNTGDTLVAFNWATRPKI